MQGPDMRFIDLATRLLESKEEARDQARTDLMDRLAHASPSAKDDSLEDATARLEGSTPLPLRKVAARFVTSLVVLGVVLMAYYAAAVFELVGLSPFHQIRFPKGRIIYEARMDRLAAKMSPDQQLFFFANTIGNRRPDVNRWRAEGMDHLPEDPAWFEEFSVNTRRFGEKFSGRYREHGKRIDPGNGIWALRDAEALGGALRDNSFRTSLPSTLLASPEYQEVISLIEEAGQAPRIESYIPERTKTRLGMLGAPSDLAGFGDRINMLFGHEAYISGVGVNEMFATRAKELASKKDVEGLRKWIALGEKLSMESLRNPDAAPAKWAPLFGGKFDVARVVKVQAVNLGLVDEAARLQRWIDEVAALDVPLAFDLGLHASKSATPITAHGVLSRQGLVTMEELEPGRRAEHALVDRYTALFLAGSFTLLAVLAFVEAWRRPLPVRGLAQGLMPLLRRSDYLWLLGLGGALPLVWYVAIMRITPMGCRDFAIGLASHVPLYARVAGLFLLSVCMLWQTAAWRLAKRGGFIGMGSGLLWPGWVVAAFVALYLPVTGLARFAPKMPEIYLLCGLSALGVPLLWLLWQFGALVFRPRQAALGGVMLFRMLLPAFLLAAVGLLALTPLLKMEERTWVARDTVGGPALDGGTGCVLGARWQVLFCERLLKAME